MDDLNLRVAEGQGAFVPTPVRPPYVYETNGVKHDDMGDHNGLENLKLEEELTEAEEMVNPHYVEPPQSISGASQASNHTARAMVPAARNMQQSSFSISGTINFWCAFINI